VLTTSAGAWAFNDLAAAKACVFRVVQQTGWTRTAPAAGYFNLTPASGQVIGNKNFGERK
jgi:hypothetical protein